MLTWGSLHGYCNPYVGLTWALLSVPITCISSENQWVRGPLSWSAVSILLLQSQMYSFLEVWKPTEAESWAPCLFIAFGSLNKLLKAAHYLWGRWRCSKLLASFWPCEKRPHFSSVVLELNPKNLGGPSLRVWVFLRKPGLRTLRALKGRLSSYMKSGQCYEGNIFLITFLPFSDYCMQLIHNGYSHAAQKTLATSAQLKKYNVLGFYMLYCAYD